MSDLVKFLSKILLACLLVIAVGWATYIGVRYYHAEQVAYRWISGLAAKQAEWEKRIAAEGGNTLTGFTKPDLPRPVQGFEGKFAGLAYDPLQKRLLAVANKPTAIIVLSMDGQLLANLPVKGMSDINGIAWMGGNRVALVNGKRNRVVLTEIPATPQTLDVTRAFALLLRFGEGEDANQGFNGLGYDLKRDRLYISKEHSPRSLYRVSGLNYLQSPDSRGLRIENISHWLDEVPFATDLSSVEADPSNGRVFLLSEESQLILQLDGDSGQGRGMLSLSPKGSKPMPRPEGIATDDSGSLYIVSEPNLFYRLKKP
jgi:uncharacterized protein YjiK